MIVILSDFAHQYFEMIPYETYRVLESSHHQNKQKLGRVLHSTIKHNFTNVAKLCRRKAVHWHGLFLCYLCKLTHYQ